MNKHSVKFVRGSKTIWDQLNTTPEKIDNNTLYFIYEDENYSVGKLYLGQRLITDDKIINIKDIGDIQIDDESLIDKQILIYNKENQEWKNSSLEEIIDLSNYYTKNEVDNKVNDISTKMDLAPLNPTTEQIAALPSGQLYSDTANNKAVIKGGQQFYDSSYINSKFNQTPKITYNNGNPSTSDTNFKRGDIWVNEPGDVWTVVWVNQNAGIIRWERITRHVTQGYGAPPATVFVASGKLPEYKDGDLYIKHGSSWNVIEKVYMLSGFTISGTTCALTWLDISSLVDLSDYYTKAEIDTALNAKENTSNKVTSLSSSSTDDEYPSAKCMYDFVTDQIGDVSTKMGLVPLNPTAQEIEDIPSGQLYGDTTNHKGIIKGGQEFYDTTYIDENYRKTYTSDKLPPHYCIGNDTNNMDFNLGDKWVFNPPSNQGYNNSDYREYVLTRIERSGMYGLNYMYIWVPTTRLFYDNQSPLPTTEEYRSHLYTINGKYYGAYALSRYSLNDVFLKNGAYYVIDAVYITGTSDASYWVYQLRHLMSETEIDQKGYLTLDTLPIYDGTVI